MSETTSVNVTFGANVSQLQEGTTAAAEAVKTSTESISQASTEMASATTEATNEVVAGVAHMSEESEGYFASLREEIIATGESFEGLSESMAFLSTAASAMSEFFLAGLGIEKVADAIKETAENGEQLLKLSQETGIATQALSGLQVAARESGTSFDIVTRALTRLPGVMQNAVIDPTGKGALAFQALGISAQDLKMDSVSQVLDAVSSKLATYADGAQKTALVTDIFGQRAAKLIPMLTALAGDGGISGVTEKAQQYGVAVSQDAAEADEKFMKNSADLGIQLEGMRDTIGNALIPALDVLLSAMNGNSGGMNVMQAVAITLADALKVVIEVVTAVVTAFNEMIDVALGVGGELAALITAAEALAEAFAGNFHEAYESVVQAGQMMTNSWNTALSRMANQEKIFADTHNALWNSIDTSVPDTPVPTLPNAPTIADPDADKAALDAQKKAGVAALKAAQVQTTIAADAAQTQDSIAKDTTQTQIDAWNAEVAAGTITKQQETELEIQASNTQYGIQMDALNKKLSLYKEGTAQYQQVLDEETKLTADHNQQLAKLNSDLQVEIADANKTAVKNATSEWESGLAPINQAFSQTVNGMIQGTETLQEGIGKALQSIVEKFAEMGEKMLMDWVAKEAAKLTATRITQAGVTASAQAGQAQQAAMNSKSILQNAYTAASGAYAAVASIPFIGPVLAPIAAATAFAGTMAFDVISAEGGAGSIPADGTMAVLHQNEMVLPASIANPLRSNLASSSTNSSSSGGSMSITFAPNITMPGGSSSSELDSVLSSQSAAMYNYITQNYTRNGALLLPGRTA